MKIDIFDFNKFIELNAVKEVTSPIVFARGGNPDPDGLLSNIIFGIDTKSRKIHLPILPCMDISFTLIFISH